MFSPLWFSSRYARDKHFGFLRSLKLPSPFPGHALTIPQLKVDHQAVAFHAASLQCSFSLCCLLCDAPDVQLTGKWGEVPPPESAASKAAGYPAADKMLPQGTALQVEARPSALLFALFWFVCAVSCSLNPEAPSFSVRELFTSGYTVMLLFNQRVTSAFGFYQRAVKIVSLIAGPQTSVNYGSGVYLFIYFNS